MGPWYPAHLRYHPYKIPGASNTLCPLPPTYPVDPYRADPMSHTAQTEIWVH